jgi:hypothetical protein
MNDGDQYFEKKIIFMSKIFRNVASLPIHPRLNLFRSRIMGTRAVNSYSRLESSHLSRMGTCSDSVTHLNLFFFFFGVIRPFSMSVKGPQKNPFLWYLLKPGDQ